MQSFRKRGDEGVRIEWTDGALARVLLRSKHTLPVMIAVYEQGAMCTSELIRRVRGHPGTVIRAVRALEKSGVLCRVRLETGRHPVETRLTVWGIQLVETPLYRWHRLLRKWNQAPH